MQFVMTNEAGEVLASSLGSAAPLLKALKDIGYRGWTSVFMHPFPRGFPILPTAAETTAALAGKASVWLSIASMAALGLGADVRALAGDNGVNEVGLRPFDLARFIEDGENRRKAVSGFPVSSEGAVFGI